MSDKTAGQTAFRATDSGKIAPVTQCGPSHLTDSTRATFLTQPERG